MKKRVLLLFVCVVLLVSCAGIPKIDPMSYRELTGDKEAVPPVCKKTYETVIPRVAVVNFVNNTTFDYAKMVQANVQASGQKSSSGSFGAASKPGAFGAAWSNEQKATFEAQAEQTQRDVNAKLSESIEDGVVDEIVNLGGAKIFSRTELQKVMDEQKFQQSGLANDSTLVSLGKLVGVQFIITGSINNVNLSYVDLTQTKKSTQDLGKQFGLIGQIVGAVGAAAMESQEGWNIATEVTVRIIDVETGEIVLSKKVNGKHIIGKIPYPNFDALVGGIKKASSKSLLDTRPQLSKYFSLKGYIWEIRTSPDGKERIAMVNIGESHGLKGGQKLIIYTFYEKKDPMTGQAACTKGKLNVELTVSNQVDTQHAWVTIKGESADVQKVKVGQIVERAPLAGQGTFQKMGY